MSAEDYTKKIQTTRKALAVLKKDIQYRDQQVLRNEPTYTIDAQIKGQLTDINQELEGTRTLLQEIEAKANVLGIMQRDLDKRKQALRVNTEERNRLTDLYEQSVSRRVPNSRSAQDADNRENFNREYKEKVNSKQEHLALKKKQEEIQDEKVDGLTGLVRQMKGGQKEIGKELDVQDKLIDNLEAGMDENMEDMSKVRRNLGKLMQSSSYWCLILVILCEIAAIVCNLVLWNP